MLICFLQFFPIPAKGEIVISEWVHRDDYISFSVDGTIEGPEPVANHPFLYLTSDDDSDQFAPDTEGVGILPTRLTLTGSSAGRAITSSITGRHGANRFSFLFPRPLEVGETISGSFEASIPPEEFDSSGFDFPRIFWGRSAGTSMVEASTGTFQGTAIRSDILRPICSIKFSTSSCRLKIPISLGREIGVAFSPDLTPGSWIDLGNFHFRNGVGKFEDLDALRLGRRLGFYRAFLRPIVPP